MSEINEMQDREVFNQIRSIVRKKENYVPRNYKTIGGMWTVDTWFFNGVIFQVMDEGYTSCIFTDTLSVRINPQDKLIFSKGTSKDLEETLLLLTGN
jgi:hypothetical protein